MARDCLRAKDPNHGQQSQAFDNEYANLMAELGEAPKEGQAAATPAANLPPWRDPANWSVFIIIILGMSFVRCALTLHCSPLNRHAPSLPTERPQRNTYNNYSYGQNWSVPLFPDLFSFGF